MPEGNLKKRIHRPFIRFCEELPSREVVLKSFGGLADRLFYGCGSPDNVLQEREVRSASWRVPDTASGNPPFFFRFLLSPFQFA